MDTSSKNLPFSNNNIDKQIIFLSQKYRFQGVATKPNQLAKTCIQRRFTSEQLKLLTKLLHKNIIGLKKIGKSKKISQAQIFWLYYQSIPFSLETILTKSQFDVRPQTVEAALLDIKNYLISFKIYPQFQQLNIGVNQNGVIKVYISAEDLIKVEVSPKKIQDCDKKIKQIKNWYANQYSRRSLKPSQRPKLITEGRLSQTKINKLAEIKYDFQKIRKNIKSQQAKNTSFVALSRPNQDKNINELSKDVQSKFTRMNSFDQNPSKLQKNYQDNAYLETRQLIKKYSKNFNFNSQENQKVLQKYVPDYDDQSVDTYQMELGEDFQMPSIRTNQRLRQTFTNKKSWDTLTYKNPNNINKKRKIHESAGKKDFLNIVQSNKKMLRQIQIGRTQRAEDDKTVQENHKTRNWLSSTIKSTLPPNIQDRVQQALAKTKNVMQLLKNTKNQLTTYK